MNLQKVEAKIGAVNELGCRLDDNLENAQKDLNRSEGAALALKTAISSYETLILSIEKELNSQDADLEDIKNIKKYLDRGRSLLSNLYNNAENNKVIQAGKVQGFEIAISIAKKYKDEEVTKIQRLKDALESGEIIKEGNAFIQQEVEANSSAGPSRMPGVRPTRTLKEIRLEEEKNNAEIKSQKEVISTKKTKEKKITKK